MPLYYPKQYPHDPNIIQALISTHVILNKYIPLISPQNLFEQLQILKLQATFKIPTENFKSKLMFRPNEYQQLLEICTQAITPIPVIVPIIKPQPNHLISHYSKPLNLLAKLLFWPSCHHLANYLSSDWEKFHTTIAQLRNYKHSPLKKIPKHILPDTLFKFLSHLEKNKPSLSKLITYSPITHPSNDHELIDTMETSPYQLPLQNLSCILATEHATRLFFSVFQHEPCEIICEQNIKIEHLTHTLPITYSAIQPIQEICHNILQKADIKITPKVSQSEKYLYSAQKTAQIKLREDERKTSTYGLIQYENCPFQYFAEKRLQIMPTPTEGQLNAMRNGRITHFVLEKLPNPRPVDLQKFLQLTLPTCKDFQTLPQILQKTTYKRLENLLNKWLQSEEMRTNFTTHGKEITCSYRAKNIQIKGRVDRIDRLSDNSLIIIDYKTAPSSIDWYNDTLSQLPIYSLMFEQVKGLAFGVIHHSNVKLYGHCDQDLNHPPLIPIDKVSTRFNHEKNWQTQISTWKKMVDLALDQFAQGNINPKPKRILCQSCHHASFCRFKQRSEC